ncbi:MAG: crosslink repair DNA glycosylase YcaQ family protein [Maricaulaceae bacterium]
MGLSVKNREARWLWLSSQGLAETPTGPLDLLQIIKDLGFVQLDSIRNITRAHHHILWSRNQNYREGMLWSLMSERREVFEHFTHDASVIAMEFYPMWERQFSRMKQKIQGSWYADSPFSDAEHQVIKDRIQNEGPLSTRAFNTKIEGKKEMWARPPHKKALDYMWYCGELTTSHRENFVKFYDLPHRIIPAEYREKRLQAKEQIDSLCHAALNRMGFGSLADIQKFWDAVDMTEVKAWADRTPSLVRLELETHDGGQQEVFAPKNIETRLLQLKRPTSRLRLINPFDPAIRDRTRLKYLFGMDYKIEIFVPAAKRQYGYYVYPMLEGDKFIGRIEVKADRKKDHITVYNIWLEPNIKWAEKRAEKLKAELTRLARFIGVSTINMDCDVVTT